MERLKTFYCVFCLLNLFYESQHLMLNGCIYEKYDQTKWFGHKRYQVMKRYLTVLPGNCIQGLTTICANRRAFDPCGNRHYQSKLHLDLRKIIFFAIPEHMQEQLHWMRIHPMFPILCGQSIFARQQAWQIRCAISHVYLSVFLLIIVSEAALMDVDSGRNSHQYSNLERFATADIFLMRTSIV